MVVVVVLMICYNHYFVVGFNSFFFGAGKREFVDTREEADV